MHREKSCIASLEFMHDEKISCLVKFIYREKALYLAGIYARREHFMPRQIYTLREDFIPRGKIFMPRKRTYTDKEREIVYPKNNIYPLASIAFCYLL